MNKFTRLFYKITSNMLVIAMILPSVYAEENGTGSTIATKSGSVIEQQELKEVEPITDSGSLPLIESGTGSELDAQQSYSGSILLEESAESQTNLEDVLIETETGSSVSDLEETSSGEVLTESEGREKAMEEITAEDEYTEILIKYRDDKINVLRGSGKAQAEKFIERKNNEIKPALMNVFEHKKGKETKMQKLEAETNLLEKEKEECYFFPCLRNKMCMEGAGRIRGCSSLKPFCKCPIFTRWNNEQGCI